MHSTQYIHRSFRLLVAIYYSIQLISQDNYYNFCHQMSDFKAKIHQIRFRLGLSPRPRWGAYSAPPDPHAGFKGPTSKGREGKGRRVEGGTLNPPVDTKPATPLSVMIGVNMLLPLSCCFLCILCFLLKFLVLFQYLCLSLVFCC